MTNRNETDETLSLANLGELEKRVLGVLRESGTSLPVTDVTDRVATRDEEWSYSTVSTVLSRLHDRGLATREREEYPGGWRYQYSLHEAFTELYAKRLYEEAITVLGENELWSFIECIEEDQRTDTSDDAAESGGPDE